MSLHQIIIEILEADKYVKWLSYNPDDDDRNLVNANFKLNDKICNLTRLMNNDSKIALEVVQQIYKYDSIVGLEQLQPKPKPKPYLPFYVPLLFLIAWYL